MDVKANSYLLWRLILIILHTTSKPKAGHVNRHCEPSSKHTCIIPKRRKGDDGRASANGATCANVQTGGHCCFEPSMTPLGSHALPASYISHDMYSRTHSLLTAIACLTLSIDRFASHEGNTRIIEEAGETCVGEASPSRRTGNRVKHRRGGVSARA